MAKGQRERERERERERDRDRDREREPNKKYFFLPYISLWNFYPRGLYSSITVLTASLSGNPPPAGRMS